MKFKGLIIKATLSVKDYSRTILIHSGPYDSTAKIKETLDQSIEAFRGKDNPLTLKGVKDNIRERVTYHGDSAAEVIRELKKFYELTEQEEAELVEFGKKLKTEKGQARLPNE